MKPMSYRQACEELRRQLKNTSDDPVAENKIIGICGYVASGKTRLSHTLCADAEVLLRRTVTYLPFDLWINHAMLDAATYAERFLLNDFGAAVRCMRNGERFLVPRYDIMKVHGVQSAEQQLATSQLLWNDKHFLQCTNRYNERTLHCSIDLYIEPHSGYVYSLFPASSGQAYVIDGTMIFPTQIADVYDIKVFVRAPWSLRVARMIRRFNRKEVFGTTTKSIEEYVGFLVAEARSCADEEIFLQVDERTLVVESGPQTLSNYLDLAYLRLQSEQSAISTWVTTQEVEDAMRTCLNDIRGEDDIQTLELWRRELLALMESKHLLALPGADEILGTLASILL